MSDIKCYKIVREINNKLYSFQISLAKIVEVQSLLKYNLEYKLNETMNCIENTFGIFCFKTLDSAIDYLLLTIKDIQVISATYDFKIFSAEGYEELEVPKEVSSIFYINNYYKNKFENSNFPIVMLPAPNDTICFKSIKLIKEFKWRN